MSLHNDPAACAALLYLAYAIGSSAVRALPEPKPGAPPAYVWFYGFAHALGANWDRVRAALLVILKISA